MTYHVSREIFGMPYDDKYIIYAPLKRLAFVVSPAVVNLLNEITLNANKTVSRKEKKLLRMFRELGLVNEENETMPVKADNVFAPTYVTLFLTNKCNLRCIYCYASGGEKAGTTIPRKVAKSAIDLIINNALSKNQKSVGVGFHGGGEPTIAWKTLVECVEYARGRSSEQGLQLNLSIATNGIISAKKLRWIMDNFTSLNLSLDGTEEVQNYHRPLANGGGSFKRVIATVIRMNERNFPYGIRATVTAKSVARLDECVEFLASTCKAKSIHLEPTFTCGRCLYTGVQAPGHDEFISGYRKAQKTAEKVGISIFYSGARLNTITSMFCKASGDSFCVTPQSDVTSCYEVCSKEDPRSEVFFYGKYDQAKGTYIFNEDKLTYLRSRTVNNIPHCEDCFCKYHCAGDCLAKASDGNNLMSIHNTERCKINQTLTMDAIIRILDGTKGHAIRL